VVKMRPKSGDVVGTVALGVHNPTFERAELRFEGLVPPEDSFELRIFLGEPKANAETRITGNPHYLGSQYFYGTGPRGSGDPDSSLAQSDREQQFASVQIRLNITDRLREYLHRFPTSSAALSIVAVDRRNAEILDPELSFDGVSIVTT